MYNWAPIGRKKVVKRHSHVEKGHEYREKSCKTAPKPHSHWCIEVGGGGKGALPPL